MPGIVTQFEIEWAGVIGRDRPVLIARKLVAGDVRVVPGATLGGCQLVPVIEDVHLRKLRPDGRPRSDLVGFELADARDLHRLAPGQVVDLVNPTDPRLEPLLGIVAAAESLGTRTTAAGARLVGHVPHVAPEAYLHVLFAPLEEPDIDALAVAVQRTLPSAYRALLRTTNGLSIFTESLNIYGSRQTNARVGDAAWQPFSAITPNTVERPPRIPSDAVVIGGYGHDGSKLYVRADDVVIRCGRRDGASLNEWPDLFTMLSAEARRLTTHFDASGRLTSGGRWSAPPPEPDVVSHARA